MRKMWMWNSSIYNVEFCHAEIEEVYHELFDEAFGTGIVDAKQKRNDRKIDGTYYEKNPTRASRKSLFYEAVFQIGNKDDVNAKSEEETPKEILIEFMERFSEAKSISYVFSAHLPHG